MKNWVLGSAAALSLLVLAGCGSTASGGQAEKPREITVVNAKAGFNTKELQLAKGQPVRLTLDNQDGVLHDLSIEKMPVTDLKEKSAGSHGHDTKLTVHVSADAGKAGSVEFTPTEAGTYTFYCTVAGHREMGMQGKVTVN